MTIKEIFTDEHDRKVAELRIIMHVSRGMAVAAVAIWRFQARRDIRTQEGRDAHDARVPSVKNVENILRNTLAQHGESVAAYAYSQADDLDEAARQQWETDMSWAESLVRQYWPDWFVEGPTETDHEYKRLGLT
jgi:hypothetical protein